jgi:hypothetical protein
MRLLPKTLLLVAAIHATAFAIPAYAQTPPPPLPAPTPAPTPAPAPNVGGDVIHLKGGGILRGTIIDAIPGNQARIQLATGEIATVPWAQIERIDHSTAQAPSPTPSPATPATGSTAPAPPPPSVMVYVHIEGGDDVQLLQDKTGNGDWATVCYAPCDKQLPTGPMYRVDSPSMKTSNSFHLTASDAGQHESISVHGASTPLFVLGCIAVPVGGIAGYFGLILGLTGSLVSSSTGGSAGGGVEAAGWAAFAIGAGAVVVGVLLVISNMKTTVSQDVAVQGATGQLVPSDAYKRMPSWTDPSPIDRVIPPVIGVPILSGHF